MNHEAVIKNLQELGYTSHEASIYVAVLAAGEASAGKVLDEVKLHREQVYRALKRLVAEGLLTHYTKRKRGYYAAVDPEIIVKKITTKVQLAQSLQPILKEMHQNRPQVIRISEGKEALMASVEDVLKTLNPGDEYMVLGGVGETFYELSKDFISKYHKQFLKKNIRLRIIGAQGQSYSKELQSGSHISVRFLPRPYGVPASTVIYGDKVAIEVFDEEVPENVAIITIENKKIAASYRHTFETMWELAVVR